MSSEATVMMSPLWILAASQAFTPFEEAAALRPEYDRHAFIFVFQALGKVMEQLPEQRHITGRELAHGMMETAKEAFGISAPMILGLWGIRRSEDIGNIVFALCDAGVMGKREEDRREDFDALFTVDEIFAGEYEWPGVRRLLEARLAE